jgi:DNA modification methylase
MTAEVECCCPECGAEFSAKPEGGHRLLCGDSTVATDVERVLGGVKIDMLLTDPPYCSGGFQEAGKAAGSVGTRGTEMIANDTLSTRGYMALMKATIPTLAAGVVYVFTDWRMWINIFDVVESSGYGVRNMIVWDKGTPGMGAGWRMQHD